MAGLLLRCSRRLFSSGALLNRKRAPIIDQVRMMKEAESENRENWELFKSWKLKYNKNYKSKEEILYRYNRFCNTKREVEMLNKGDSGCTYAVNFFADMPRREFTDFNGKIDYSGRARARARAGVR